MQIAIMGLSLLSLIKVDLELAKKPLEWLADRP